VTSLTVSPLMTALPPMTVTTVMTVAQAKMALPALSAMTGGVWGVTRPSGGQSTVFDSKS
jgi:hypothetical protein